MFDTVEINNTFYRLPPEGTVKAWAAAAPQGFIYALKLGAFGTHRMKLRDAASWLPNHIARLDLLGQAAGPTLVQLPPRWQRNVERLDEFLAERTESGIGGLSSFANASWLHDDVFETLERHGAALCVHDLLPKHPFVLTTDWTLHPLSWPECPEAAVPRKVRRASARPLGRPHDKAPRRGSRRLRVLQQRLRRPCRERR